MNDTLKRYDITAVLMRLAELCPQCIFVWEKRRRPLQVGIRNAIIERVAGRIEPHELNAAMRSYVRSVGYLQSVARGDMRVDTESNPTEPPTPQQMAAAQKVVSSFFARRAERRAASVVSAPEPVVVEKKRLGLADLKLAAQARKAVVVVAPKH